MWLELSIISLILFSFFYMFAGSPSGEKNGVIRLIAAVGAVMGAHAVFMLLLGSAFRLYDVVRYLPASVCYIASAAAGIAGIKLAAPGDRLPILNMYGAAAVVICAVTGKTDSLMNKPIVNMISAALILAGIVLSALSDKRYAEKKEKIKAAPLLLSAACCVLRGLGMYADGCSVVKRGVYGSVAAGFLDESAALVSFELTAFAAAAVFVCVLIIKKEPLFDKRTALKDLIAGVFAALGSLAYFYAVGNQTVLTAAVVSSAPAVSALFARIFLEEKQPKTRYAALALIAAGLAVVTVC